MASLQSLCEYNGYLYGFWKGQTGDDRLFYSRFDGTQWSEQQSLAANSSVGPSAATYGGRLFVAWKGTADDQRIFWLQIDGDHWYGQAPIGASFNSSHGPSLSALGDRLYAAWKGEYDDQTVWFASTNNAGWTAPRPIPGAFSRVGPSLATLNNRLVAVWRGAGADQGLWYATTPDGVTWSAPTHIPNVGSSVGPSVTAAGDRLYAAWKGVIGDEQLWWSSFNPKTNVWATQQKVPNAFSSVGPALGAYQGKAYAMWKGPGTHQNLSFSANLSLQNLWTKARPGPGSCGQDSPVNIGVPLQYQETLLWCWLACAASVAHFYDRNSTANQPDMMTAIGRKLKIEGYDSVTECAPTPKMLKDDPVLAANYSDPFRPAALLCLEDAPIPSICHRSGGLGDALGDNYAGNHTTATLAEIAKELDAGRPVVASIRWNTPDKDGNFGEHYVIIAGVLNDQILVLDPGYPDGEKVIAYEDFPSQYRSGATLLGAAFTKRK